MSYQPEVIEQKWRRFWADNDSFVAGARPDLPKYYALDMFPYPSAKGLHVGHVEGYTASDIVSRFKRMKGFDVLHPMGWDAFGLPAEQHAIETGVHPASSTRANIENFHEQCDLLGLSFDWSREFSTSDPEYYKWTQWIFLKLFEHALAYRAEAVVNWCPALGCVLANDEVTDGKSERGGFPVYQKPMTQWMLKITAYADRLLEGLNTVDFPESLKAMQRERIGRSEGADILFSLCGREDKLLVFTTRPDTLFGATFCVLAPEHPLVREITTPEQRTAVENYQREVANKTELLRTGVDSGKTGVFTGGFAISPANNERIPVWISDYVLMSYGSGAVMSVPGHDQRDWNFARQFNLPIAEVVSGGNPETEAWTGDGVLVHSGFLNGLKSAEAKKRMTEWLAEQGVGKPVVRYRMRDWIFARQRYWGEPVPVVYDEQGGIHPVPDQELPLLLPHLEDFKPTGGGEAPLSRLPDWVKTTMPGTDRPGCRETHTMPALAASSWYFLRFADPRNPDAPFDPKHAVRWMPVDLYIGGAEHAVGHLMYARFITKFLYDLGLCPVEEPFRKVVNQGMILGEDHRKMSKRYGNVINPTDVIGEYGADTLRLYEMALGPVEATKPWNTAAIEGSRRFLNRVWRLFFDADDSLLKTIDDSEPSDAQLRLLHRTIAKVNEDTENLRFNTAIAQMTIFVNEMTQQAVRPRKIMERFVLVLAPYAPHICEEIWNRLGHSGSLIREPFPVADVGYCQDEVVSIGVQIDGRIRERINVTTTQSEAEVLELALKSSRIQQQLQGKVVVRTKYVPGRLVSIATR